MVPNRAKHHIYPIWQVWFYEGNAKAKGLCTLISNEKSRQAIL